MKKGFIYIIGQIGSFMDAKGVELMDIIDQVKKQGEVDEYNVLVNGPGGIVQTGYEIDDYLNSLDKPVNKIIYKQSASIDTVISSSKRKNGGKRYGIVGAEIFVHNPWTTQSGDAQTMLETANSLQETEDEMVDFYVTHTGLTKEAISPLMKRETSMSVEEALKLGFIDEILTEEQAKELGIELKDQVQALKPVAMIKTKKQDMNKLEEIYAKVKEMHKKVFGKDETPETKTLDLKANDGTVLSVQSEESAPKIGDTVYINGKESPEKNYTLENGDVIKVNALSKIVEIISKEIEDKSEIEALKQKVAGLEQENTALKLAKQNDEKIVAEIEKKLVILNKEIKSEYQPTIYATGFRTLKTSSEGTGSEAAKRKMEELKNRKKHEIK